MFSKHLSPLNKNAHHMHTVNQSDGVSQWIQQYFISVWAVYLLILGLLIVFFNALAWIAGLIPVGTFDLYRSSIPCYPIGSLMLIHYLIVLRVGRSQLSALCWRSVIVNIHTLKNNSLLCHVVVC